LGGARRSSAVAGLMRAFFDTRVLIAETAPATPTVFNQTPPLADWNVLTSDRCIDRDALGGSRG
jgi:hypothetical protein